MAAASRAREWALRLYEWPFLLAASLYMLWVRLLTFEPYLGGGHVYYIGTDPYYHLRVVIATVANFPATLRFDPFTQYPLGTGTGQFGSLFDIAAAGLAILWGGGNPDEHTIRVALGVFPAILGALIVFPFYFLARRLVGRVGAIFATVALALLPGEFLVRSLAGYADHHVAEALGMTLALLGVFAAVERAAAANASLARLRSDPKALLKPLLACVLGALGVVVYFLAWPPAILVVGIFVLFFGIHYVVEHWRGNATGYLAFSGAVTFAIASVLLLPFVERPELNFNTFSYLQPLSCALLAVGVLALEGASRVLRARKLHPATLPAGGVAAAALAFFAVEQFLPRLHASLKWGASWVTGVGVQRTMLTIAEAHTADVGDFVRSYGLLIYVLFVALGIALVSYALKRRRADLLFVIWGILMLRAAWTQVRFTYYLALAVAIGFGYVAYVAAHHTGLNAGLARYFASAPREETPKKKPAKGRRAQPEASLAWHQGAALALVALLILPVNVFATEDGNPGWKLQGWGPDQNLQLWTEALQWMDANTPRVGVDLKDVHERPPPGESFQYMPGTYGVLSWWDYGHWIEVEGKRPPVANPFQQNAPMASKYFTATEERVAEEILANYSARNPTSGGIRYVMIDDEMAAGKFGAITVWAGWRDNFAQERHRRDFDVPSHGKQKLYTAGEDFDKTMMARLYFDDANGLHHYRLVHETPTFAVIGNIAEITEEGFRLPRFHDVISRSTWNPSDPVAGRDQVIPYAGNLFAYDLRRAGSVKTYEHVEGAHLVGDATPGATVTAGVQLRTDRGREFVYQASTIAGPDGRFDLVVPYSTTGYLTPEDGGTNLTVKAVGGYEVVEGDLSTSPIFASEVQVPERTVLEGGRIEVRLTQ